MWRWVDRYVFGGEVEASVRGGFMGGGKVGHEVEVHLCAVFVEN